MQDALTVWRPSTWGVATYPVGATYGPRTLRDFEFVWILEGDVAYWWGEVPVPAPAGTVLLCRPGVTDFFQWDPRRRTRHAYFHFDLPCLAADWPSVESWPLARQPEEGDILRPLFRHVLTWAGRGDSIACRSATLALLAAFVTGEYATGEPLRDPLPEAVARVWAYIQNRLEEDTAARIDLAELAGVAYVTPEHLCRLFKNATGWSPVETVRLARLDRAAVLLARSNYSVGEIAALCGFSSPFHFSRRFREAFGQSPRDLRKAIQAGGVPPAPRLRQLTAHQFPADIR